MRRVGAGRVNVYAIEAPGLSMRKLSLRNELRNENLMQGSVG
jgi:lambda repressor-like predicted transcriptional regulator